MNITIVGGGTAGFVTALILKHSYPGYKVSVIKSSSVQTIGVGEGTTDHWSEFMDFCQITTAEIIKNCGATFKSGIMFEDWCANDYLHSVENHFTERYNKIPITYGYLAASSCNPSEFVPDILWNSKVTIPENILETIDTPPVNQYHFDTELLGTFLEKLSLQRGISVYNDTITEVKIADNQITELLGERVYTADLFIDCSGFAKLLIGKLGAKWQSYKDYLQVDSAITFRTDNNDYPMWTLARALSSGWMFSIPVQGRKGNGYIFSSKHINQDQAKQEVENLLGHSISIAKHIQFEPGKLDKFWIGNCVAIGLSSSFIEPLEASSIGSTIQQAFLLSEHLYAYDKTDIDLYNHKVDAIMENIRDFVFLHYITERAESEFWKAQKSIKYPTRLQSQLEKWKERLPVDSDFTETTEKVLFKADNFIIVLYSLGLLDSSKIKKQLSYLPANVIEHAKQGLKELKLKLQNTNKVSHQTMINLIRDL